MIAKFGLMLLLAGGAVFAQQAPPPPLQTQPPAIQAPVQGQIAEAERKRFEDIRARRERGEKITPEEQRFLQQIRTRLNRVQRGAIVSAVERQQRMRLNQVQRQGAQIVRPARPALERALGVPGGRWWTRPAMAQKLGLTPEQTKKMDDIFQQHRLKLIDLNATLQKEDAIMEPLVGADQPEEAKIVAQIDKVAQARAELEKANARMLLGIRRLLTQEQWNKLKGEAPAAAR
jgi:Spy/CpxP family protein refolding chaperone